MHTICILSKYIVLHIDDPLPFPTSQVVLPHNACIHNTSPWYVYGFTHWRPFTISNITGRTSSFNMTFRSLRNSPLDVYFLLDISSSLNEVLNTLRTDLVSIGTFMPCRLHGVMSFPVIIRGKISSYNWNRWDCFFPPHIFSWCKDKFGC